MKFVPNAVSRKIARQVLIGQKHSPTILFATGVVGVVATTVVACRATLKLEEVLEDSQKNIYTAREVLKDHRSDYTENDYKKDMAVIYVQSALKVCKLYAPAIVLGSFSISCLAGSHTILTRRNASLTAAYAVLEKGFNEYRQRVIEEIGAEKERDIRYATEKCDYVDEETGKKVKGKVPGAAGASIYARFFDETCAPWSPTPEYNLVYLQNQQNFLNDMLHARGHVFLNEVYDSLGIPRSKAGAVVGWLRDSADDFIDFGVFDHENYKARQFVNGLEGAILLDFNVDGVIYDKI